MEAYTVEQCVAMKLDLIELKHNLIHLPRNDILAVSLEIIDACIKIVKNGTVAYFGFSGIFSSNDCIQIDSSVANALSLYQADTVQVEQFLSYEVPVMVSVEPVTTDDWEILASNYSSNNQKERNADYLERQILNQIRFVYFNQVFPLWINGHMKLMLRVVNIQSNSRKTQCFKLSESVEISISPKNRFSPTNDKLETFAERSVRAITLPLDNLHLENASLSDVYINCQEFEGRSVKLVTLKSKQSFGVCRHDTRIPAGHAFVSKCLQRSLEIDHLSKIRISAVAPSPNTPAVISTTETKAKDIVQVVQDWLKCQPKPVLINTDTEFYINDKIPIEISLLEESRKQSFLYYPSDESIDSQSFSLGKVLSSARLATKIPQQQQLADELLGLETIETEIKSNLQFALGSTNVCSILVSGPLKSGKSELLKRVMLEAQTNHKLMFHCVFVDLQEWKQGKSLDLLRNQMNSLIYPQCIENAPSLVIFDNLDGIFASQNKDEHQKATTEQLSMLLIKLLKKFKHQKISFLASTTGFLDETLSENVIFDYTVSIPPLTVQLKSQLLENYIAMKSNFITSSVDAMQIATKMDGYSAVDIKAIVDRSIQTAILSHTQLDQLSPNALQLGYKTQSTQQKKLTISNDLITKQVIEYIPSNLTAVSKASPCASTGSDWQRIGGMKEIKRVLLETLQYPTRYAKLFKNIPLRLRSGILLYGYPGCGKTMIATAAAVECGCNFIQVKGPELLNKYIGQSEQSVRDVFFKARNAAPCILFFDEFDSLAPKRGHDSTGATDRVVNQFLTEMDGAEGLQGVFVVAATSRPDLIDPALLRPGRLDKALFCDYPNEEEIQEIVELAIQSIEFDADVSTLDLAQSLVGFTGADIQAFVSLAHMKAVQSFLETIDTTRIHKTELPQQQCDYAVWFKGRKLSLGDLTFKEKEDIKAKLIELELHSRIPARQEISSSFKLIVNSMHIKSALAESKPALSPKDKTRFTRAFKSFDSEMHGEALAEPTFGTRSTLA